MTTVVHLITTLTQGGAERVLSETVPLPGEHPGERHVVVSLVPGGMFADVLRERGVEVRDLGMRPGRDLVRGTVRLVRVLREVRADVVIGWMYHACLVAELAASATRWTGGRAARPATVWQLRGSLHSLEGLPSHTRLVIRLLARLSRRPGIVAVNSATGRRHHTRAGYRPRRWALTPNGVDATTFTPGDDDRIAVRSEIGIPPDAVVAISVARVHPQKDHAALLAAVQAVREDVPGLLLMLVGTGTEQLSSWDPDAHHTVIGLGERRDVPRLLRAADLLVSSSLTEGLPNAVLEGMASGLPAVATDVGASAEVVGPTGEIVPAGDSVALTAGIRRIAGMDITERRSLGAAARSRVVEHFSTSRARLEYRALWDASSAAEVRHDPRRTSPLRVVHVIARMNVGGPAQILVQLLEHMDARRVEQHIIHGEVGTGEQDWFAVRAPERAADPRLIRVSGFGRAIAPFSDLRTLRELRRRLLELAPDVVQTHTAKAGLVGRIAAWRAGVPHVIHTFHGHTLDGYFSRPVTALFTWMERRLAQRSDHLVAVGTRVQEELLAAGVGRPEQYVVVPPGIGAPSPVDRVTARSQLGLPPEAAVVAFIGRLTGVKRADRLITAAGLVAREIPAAIFLIVGDGEDRAALERMPSTADVRFLGWRGDVPEILAASDLVALTSDNEGMPVTLIEAAAAGRAAVTTDVGSAGEVVLDSVTGFVTPTDPTAIADAIVRLLADDGLRSAFGRAAQAHAQERFSIAAIVSTLEGVYHQGPTGQGG